MPASSSVLLTLVALAAAAGTVHAQPGCVGIGYVCSRSPCCNPFRCCYADKTCPRNIKPCCVPRCPSAREEALGLSADFLLAIEQARDVDPKREPEKARALEKVIFAEIARADAVEAEAEDKNKTKTVAQNMTMIDIRQKLVGAPEAQCLRTANACTANSQCCSKRCMCQLIISDVCCAP